MRNPLAAAITALLVFSTLPALAAPPPEETFIRTNVEQVLAILSNPALDEQEKAQQFQKKIEQVADLDAITHYVLGRWSKTADAASLARFASAFRDYAISVYQDDLDRFGNEILAVHSTVERKPGDRIVLTTLSEGGFKRPEDVKWRVLTIHGAPRVVDIQVHGVWLTLHQRSDITSVIARNHGNIDAATKMLCARSGKCGATALHSGL